MKKILPILTILLGIAILIWAYVDCYQLNLEELRQPGAMYCGFLPLGVVWELTWREQYLWVRILCPILVVGGIIFRAVLRKKENIEE